MIHLYNIGDHVQQISSGRQLFIVKLTGTGNLNSYSGEVQPEGNYECAWVSGIEVCSDYFMECDLSLVQSA
ncbi:hypothetical protein [Ferruginibacter sp.]|uniref:hypothetical protein n=1 Tax=Ferruginibacter sp. TaxID=1940288 RepID=UPI00265B0926|nr:hypothetical protein [Ferruginibacter sp.]